MSVPKLTYFDMNGGRGEYIRLAFHHGGVKFEDNRIKYADWPALKPAAVWGSVPTLEVPGKGTLGQSGAILRYVGKQTNLYPKDDFEAALVDDILDACEDVGAKVGPTMQEKDDAKKKEAREALLKDSLPTIFGNLNKAVGTKGKFVLGDHLTIADLKLFVIVNWFSGGTLDHIPKDWVDQFTNLKRVHSAVAEDPKIKEYYASRK